MAAVDEFLHQLDEGEFESHGAFTIDVSLARLKLAKFQLNSGTERILKLLQGMVLLRGDKIWLNLTGATVSVLVEKPALRLQLGDLREALESAQLASESTPQKHLGIGLCALLAEGHTSVFWVDYDSHAEAHIEKIYGDEQKAKLKIPKAAEKANACCLHLQGLQLPGIFGMVGPELALDLIKRCAFMPVPLFLNGSLAQKRTWAPPPSHWRGGEIYVDSYHVDPAQEERILLCPPGPCQHQLGDWPNFLDFKGLNGAAGGEMNNTIVRTLETPTPLLPVTLGKGNFNGLSSLFHTTFTSSLVNTQLLLTEPTEPSWLWPIHAGVMLEPQPLRLPVPGVHVVCAAAHIHTDLSQYRPLQDESWRNLEESLIGPLRQLLSVALQDTRRVQPGARVDGMWTWLGLTGLLCVPALLTNLLNLPDAACLGAWIAGLILPWRGYRKDQAINHAHFGQESRKLWQKALDDLGAQSNTD